MASLVPSSKGKNLLVENGYTYNYDRTTTDELDRYRCQYSRKQDNKCLATVYTEHNTANIRRRVNEAHSHGPDPAKIEVMKVRGSAKRRAIETQEPVAAVIEGALEDLSAEGHSRISQGSLKRYVFI